ncbi:DUF7489 domain-containing protein [Actinoplanes sp. NPDC049316]|uniref:DUF7489 domain-containing protein n=1 Tax=Actinoplanes sp. NPDC049316 TaxID=3154727 RepID=UPI00343A58F7
MTKDAWEGTVIKKSRGLLDGSSLYRRLTIRLDDGSITKIRVSRDLWVAVTVGDTLTKASARS